MVDNFETLFNRAIEIAGGSENKLAAAAGCSQNAIWHAKRAGRVSAQMAVRIEAATNGEVARWMLRPDLWSAPGTEHTDPAAHPPPGSSRVAPRLHPATRSAEEALT